jgi:hypothetical protein
LEAFLYALLFTIPGLMVRNIEKRFFTQSKAKESDFIKQYNFFIDSAFIYFINIIFIQILLATPIWDVIKKINKFEIKAVFLEEKQLKIMLFYFLWSLMIAFPYAYIKRKILRSGFLKISNMFRTKSKNVIETKFASVWDELFENRMNPISGGQIIILEKDGELITQGYIKRYSPPHLDRREFLLEETSAVKMYLEADKDLSEEEKLLNVVKMEYYDTGTGINIKFFDTTKLEKYLNSVN